MDQPLPRTRLYCAQPLAADRPVRLDPSAAHRLKSVLRLKQGDGLRVFNAEHGEWLCQLAELGKRHVIVMPRRQIRAPEPAADALWLLFAPLKKDAMDVLIEKAVELGVDRLLPTITAHTDVARVNSARLPAQAIAAAEQSERLSVPPIEAPARLADRTEGWPADRPLIVCAEAGPAKPIADLARAFAGGPAAIMIGPEGGLAKSELDALGKLPFSHAAGLGPRVLRAETAAIAALAIWQSVAGADQSLAGADKQRPPFRS